MAEETKITAKIITAGRTDLEDLFRLHIGSVSGLVNLRLAPLLVFHRVENEIHVEIVTEPVKLLGMPDDTDVMALWPGKWRSDYFKFTVGDLRSFFHSG